MTGKIRDQLEEILAAENIYYEEPMAQHTSFRIGGPADVLTTPENPDQIREILAVCREAEVPFFVLGNGSNLLVSDKGYRGVVIQIGRKMSGVTIEGERIRAGAGALLSGIAASARNASLTGMEFAGGIPGSLGGAVVMNAGAYGGEMKDILEEGKVITPEGEEKILPAGELSLGYRTSIIKEKEYIVTEASLKLTPGDMEEIRRTMKDLQQRRSDKQPLEFPSAGSTFKRPEGYFAGKLISDAGLRGYQVGGARVSDKHCGFVINAGGASAADVRKLMADVQEEVYRQFGVMLEPEVKFLGEF